MRVSFQRAYAGGYKVVVDGETRGYVERSYDQKGWTYAGRFFQYLAEAKAAAANEL